MIDQGLPPTAGSAYPMTGLLPIGGKDRKAEFGQTGFDGNPRESGGLRDLRDSTPLDGSGFCCSPEAAYPLIKSGFQASVLRPDDLDCGVSHAVYVTGPGQKLDRLFWRIPLI